MADTKISALTSATTPLAGTEVVPLVQSSTTKKVTVDNLTAGRSIPVAGIKYPNSGGTTSLAPAFSATISTNQTIATYAQVKVAFDTVIYDTNSNFDTTNNRFTPSVAGYYTISGCVTFDPAVGGRVFLSIFKNGSEHIRLSDATPSSWNTINGSALVYMNGSTDYVELDVYCGTGATQTVSASSVVTLFMGSLVRAA